MAELSHFFPAVVSMAVTITMIHLLVPVARRIGLVDCPDARKAHSGAVPLVGGIAMFCGVAFGLLVWGGSVPGMRALIGGGALLVIVGVLDDFHELGTRSRFVAQIIAALMMALWAGVLLVDLGHLISNKLLALGWFGIVLTVFSTVGVINAINMCDGMDGLAGGLVTTALLGLLFVVGSNGVWFVPICVVLAAVVGFLVLNVRLGVRPRAVTFMGDAGSMLLGFLLCWLLVELSQAPQRNMPPVLALWLVAIPLLDTISMMVRRKLAGRSATSADREHFHHLFLRSGFSVNRTLIIILLLAALFALAGIAALELGVEEYVMFYAFCGLSLVYLALVMRAWSTRRWLGRTVE